MKVLIIPEHPSNDHYILKPLFTRLLRNIGSTSVRVEVCQDPVLGNVDQALRLTRLKEIVEQYVGMTDIFILCVDRDGIVSRRKTLDHIEKELGSLFLAENAWEELETWALAGLSLPGEWSWAEVRSEIDVKERYFEPYAQQRGLSDSPGGGRKTLGEEASRRISAIRQKCPEDFDSLAKRLQAVI